MPEYIYLLHPLNHELAFHPTPEEEGTMNEHLEYLQQAARQDIMILAGPSLDGIFGVVIFHAENEHAAQQFMFDDPAVKASNDHPGGLMVAELHPFRVSVTGRWVDTGNPV